MDSLNPLTEIMALLQHYSPAIDRFLVSCLYHEAQERRMPMTRLVDELLRKELSGSTGWRKAEDQLSVRENPQSYQDRKDRKDRKDHQVYPVPQVSRDLSSSGE
jgi:hypothetical protein